MKFEMDKNRNEYLFSRIQVDATLHSGIAQIKRVLDSHPGIDLIREGTSLFYTIRFNEGDDHFYSLELDKKCITLTVYSKQTPAFFIQEAMLRMLSFLQILSEIYEVKIESLYPYLIMTIAQQQIVMLEHVEKQNDGILPDTILSKRIIGLLRENFDMKEKYNKMFASFRKILLRTVILSSRGSVTVEEIATELGVEEKEVFTALAGAKEAGYRVVHTGKDTFNLVKL